MPTHAINPSITATFSMPKNIGLLESLTFWEKHVKAENVEAKSINTEDLNINLEVMKEAVEGRRLARLEFGQIFSVVDLAAGNTTVKLKSPYSLHIKDEAMFIGTIQIYPFVAVDPHPDTYEAPMTSSGAADA